MAPPLKPVSIPDSGCVAIDAGSNVLTSTDPTGGASAWQRTSLEGAGLSDVSCPSATLCVAVGFAGQIYTSTNPTGGTGAWTPTTFETQSITEIDCPSTTFCAATVLWAQKVITTTNPAGGAPAWSGTDLGSSPAVVGCASAALCVVGDGGGHGYVSTGGAWTSTQISGTNSLTAVDCLPSGFCATTDTAGRVLTASSPTGTWTGRMAAAGHDLRDIDCPSASLCFAVDASGNLVWSTTPTAAGAWTITQIADARTLSGISCPTASFCLAVDTQGWVAVSTNPTGGAAAWSRYALILGTPLKTVACASASLCVVSHATGGRLRTSTHPADGAGAWATFQTPPDLGLPRGIVGISCPSPDFCAALDDGGRVHTTTTPSAPPFEWSMTTIPQAGLLHTALTCLPSTFCVAVGGSALSPLAYSSTQPADPSTWAVRTADTPNHNLVDVSCVSAASCVAVNSVGMVTTAAPAPDGTLTVTKTGDGTVTGAPAGIDCGATCSATLADGTTVTLTATAAPGSRFAGWSGACAGTAGTCQVDVIAATNVTAAFVRTAALTVAKAGSGAGTVKSAPAGIDCGTTCSALYDEGTTVTLTATPAAGSAFTGWSGPGCSGTGACTTTIGSSRTVTATFTVAVAPTPTPTPTPTATPTPTPTPTATALPTPPATPEATPVSSPPITQPGQVPTAQPAPVPRPDTRMGKKTVKQRMATFRFSATGGAKTFRCALTARGKKVVYKTCTSPATFKRLRPGTYTFRVAAVGDPTPATTTITVKRRR